MSFIKNSAAPGKKQRPCPTNSPAYKKLLAAQEGAVKAASGHAPSKTSFSPPPIAPLFHRLHFA